MCLAILGVVILIDLPIIIGIVHAYEMDKSTFLQAVIEQVDIGLSLETRKFANYWTWNHAKQHQTM